MRHPGVAIFSLGLSVICGGCVGTGPNTQQGAVTGGALGALAGGIIGNNSGSHNGASGALIGALAGALAGGALGNSVDNERGTVYGAPGENVYRAPNGAVSNYTVQQVPAPPTAAPATEVVSAPPSSAALWIPGYWAYDGVRYVWVAGHWEIPPPNCRSYVAPYWANQGGAYVYVRGYWR